MTDLNIRWVRSTHLYPSLVATAVGAIMAFKLLQFSLQWLILSVIFLFAQVFTGLVNDYLDYEADLQYQTDKATSKGLVKKSDIITGMIITGFLFLIGLLFMPFYGAVLLILGLLIAQTYNFGLKDTPLSVVVFSIGFGMMFLVAYYLKYGTSLIEFPLKFFVSGGLLAVSTHILNTLPDYSIDNQRGSNSFVQTLGEMPSYLFIILLGVFYIIFNFNLTLVVLTFLPTVVVLVLSSPLLPKNWVQIEQAYYSVTILYVIQIILLPLV